MTKTAAVVVTYNRKEDLIVGLEAIFKQTLLPDRLYIIDNKSTDGTPEHLVASGILTDLPSLHESSNQLHTESKQINEDISIDIHYVRKSVNDGGAGGFYEGMKRAYDGGYDWLWMMDDDGIPHPTQLENLVKHSVKEDFSFVNALLLNKDDHNQLAFGLKGYQTKSDILESEYVKDFINPFNGTLLRRSLIDKIGLIKREMFIWGDEKEYALRARQNDFKRATVLSAIHYHPMIKGRTENALPFGNKFKIIIKPAKMAHFYYRNLGFLENEYASSKVALITRFSYFCYFIRKGKFNELRIFIKAYSEGRRNDFSNAVMK